MSHLNFASGFFAGRALRHVAYDLNQLLGHDWLSAKVSLDECYHQAILGSLSWCGRTELGKGKELA